MNDAKSGVVFDKDLKVTRKQFGITLDKNGSIRVPEELREFFHQDHIRTRGAFVSLVGVAPGSLAQYLEWSESDVRIALYELISAFRAQDPSYGTNPMEPRGRGAMLSPDNFE